MPAQVGPQMYRVAQWLAAVASQKDLMNLTGLVADRRGPRHALQAAEILKARAIRTDLAQQAGSDFGPRSRQGAKELVIGMLGKEFLDLSAVGIDLVLERAQHAGPCQSQPALGPGQSLAGDELSGSREDFHALLVGFRTCQFVAVEELLPFAFACRLQSLRRGEGFDEGPGGWQRPVLKGFQRRGVVFVQGALELVDERSALLDQPDLVAAEQAQLSH